MKWILLGVGLSVCLALTSATYLVVSADSIPLKKMDKIQSASNIYDRNDRIIGRIGPNREYVSLKKISSKKLLTQTFVAVEDKRFYQHDGIDYQGFYRALFRNVLEMEKAEGASTITMQVARTSILENRNKTMIRKLTEIVVAKNLEDKYSKEQILQAYLNNITFGNQVMGVKMAAKIYFDKDLTKEKLQPHEVALLAGLPKATTTYNPYLHPKKAKKRRNTVLMIMAREGIITKKEKEIYQKRPLGIKKEYLDKHLPKGQYTPYKQYVLTEAKERFGLEETEITTGGYDIYTSLDPQIQTKIEETLKDNAFYQQQKTLDAGATILDPKTGNIVALAGGRYYMGTGYPLRSLTHIQPGSVIRPLLVYAPLIQENSYTEYTGVKDPPNFQLGAWKPANKQGTSYGVLAMKDAVAKSLNVPPAWLMMNRLGIQTATKYAERFGISLQKDEKLSVAALSRGSFKNGMNTLQMAQSYAAFANNGTMIQAHGIRKIKQGALTLKKKEPIKKQPINKKTAYYMTRILRYNVMKGTGRPAQLPGHEVAGQTGTSSLEREAWFVGYTNQYVMASTVFQTDGKGRLSDGEIPAGLFKEVMKTAMANETASRFENPGVPEPVPPFVLKAVRVSLAGYDPQEQSITLQWKDYDNRAKYHVERSADRRHWESVDTTTEGSFTDQPDLKKLAQPQTLYYRVVTTGPQDEDDKRISNGVKVEIEYPKQKEKDNEDKKEKKEEKPKDEDFPNLFNFH
ncbi:transglycosylase domain-containing protein [Salinithrix halophila]|uniref:Transglycosylase domain-containing protein n=1 Tax=Salinithrix halophila TaxID=1485204 RepID=A0ABV8JK81_9BACL